MIRTRQSAVYSKSRRPPLMAMTLLVMVGSFVAVFAAGVLPAVAGAAVSYFPADCHSGGLWATLTQLVKGFYSRRYGWQ